MTNRNSLIFMSLAVFVIMSAGCITQTIRLEGRRVWPANPQFTINPGNYSEDELRMAGIRIDGVYIRCGFRPQEVQEEYDEALRRKGWRTGSPYIRFWANGRMLARVSDMDVLTAGEADCFEGGILGYFSFPTNAVVEGEEYSYDPGRGGGVYSKSRDVIEGDTLWSRTRAKHKGVPVELGYKFVPIKGMKAQPDW
jgi:hypothetical protein